MYTYIESPLKKYTLKEREKKVAYNKQ